MVTGLAGYGDPPATSGLLDVRLLALETVPDSDLLGSMALFGLFLGGDQPHLEARHHDRSLGPFLMPVSLFFLLVSFVVPGGGAPRPELRGSVFAFHVTLNMLELLGFRRRVRPFAPLPRPRAAAEEQAAQLLNGPVSRLPSLSYLERAARTSMASGSSRWQPA